MKKITFLLACLHAACCFAQQYVPFPTANAVWRENGVNFSSGVPGTYDRYFYQIFITQDTVINGFTYHGLSMNGTGQAYINYQGPYVTGPPGTICNGAIREDSSKHIFYFDYGMHQ